MISVAKTCTIDDPGSTEDIIVYAGGYLQIDYTCVDSDASAVDLTGATIKFTVWDIEAGANEFQLVLQPVTDASWTTNVVTFTVADHGYSVADSVVVEDCGNSSYDGTYTVVAVPTDNTFTAALAGDPGAFTTDGYVSMAAGTVSMTTPASGTFSVALTDTQTDTDCKQYRYSLWIKLTGGTEHHAAVGSFYIYNGVYDS